MTNPLIKRALNNMMLSAQAKIEKRKEIEKLYLSFVNDFLTVGKFAEYYNLTELKAIKIINAGRLINHAK